MYNLLKFVLLNIIMIYYLKNDIKYSYLILFLTISYLLYLNSNIKEGYTNFGMEYGDYIPNLYEIESNVFKKYVYGFYKDDAVKKEYNTISSLDYLINLFTDELDEGETINTKIKDDYKLKREKDIIYDYKEESYDSKIQYSPRKVWVDGPERNVRLDYDRNSVIPSVPGSLPPPKPPGPKPPGPSPPGPKPPGPAPPGPKPPGPKPPGPAPPGPKPPGPKPPGPKPPGPKPPGPSGKDINSKNVCLLTTFVSGSYRLEDEQIIQNVLSPVISKTDLGYAKRGYICGLPNQFTKFQYDQCSPMTSGWKIKDGGKLTEPGSPITAKSWKNIVQPIYNDADRFCVQNIAFRCGILQAVQTLMNVNISDSPNYDQIATAASQRAHIVNWLMNNYVGFNYNLELFSQSTESASSVKIWAPPKSTKKSTGSKQPLFAEQLTWDIANKPDWSGYTYAYGEEVGGENTLHQYNTPLIFNMNQNNYTPYLIGDLFKATTKKNNIYTTKITSNLKFNKCTYVPGYEIFVNDPEDNKPGICTGETYNKSKLNNTDQILSGSIPTSSNSLNYRAIRVHNNTGNSIFLYYRTSSEKQYADAFTSAKHWDFVSCVGDGTSVDKEQQPICGNPNQDNFWGAPKNGASNMYVFCSIPSKGSQTIILPLLKTFDPNIDPKVVPVSLPSVNISFYKNKDQTLCDWNFNNLNNAYTGNATLFEATFSVIKHVGANPASCVTLGNNGSPSPAKQGTCYTITGTEWDGKGVNGSCVNSTSSGGSPACVLGPSPGIACGTGNKAPCPNPIPGGPLLPCPTGKTECPKLPKENILNKGSIESGYMIQDYVDISVIPGGSCGGHVNDDYPMTTVIGDAGRPVRSVNNISTCYGNNYAVDLNNTNEATVCGVTVTVSGESGTCNSTSPSPCYSNPTNGYTGSPGSVKSKTSQLSLFTGGGPACNLISDPKPEKGGGQWSWKRIGVESGYNASSSPGVYSKIPPGSNVFSNIPNIGGKGICDDNMVKQIIGDDSHNMCYMGESCPASIVGLNNLDFSPTAINAVKFTSKQKSILSQIPGSNTPCKSIPPPAGIKLSSGVNDVIKECGRCLKSNMPPDLNASLQKNMCPMAISGKGTPCAYISPSASSEVRSAYFDKSSGKQIFQGCPGATEKNICPAPNEVATWGDPSPGFQELAGPKYFESSSPSYLKDASGIWMSCCPPPCGDLNTTNCTNPLPGGGGVVSPTYPKGRCKLNGTSCVPVPGSGGGGEGQVISKYSKLSPCSSFKSSFTGLDKSPTPSCLGPGITKLGEYMNNSNTNFSPWANSPGPPNPGDYLQAAIHFNEESGEPLYPGNFNVGAAACSRTIIKEGGAMPANGVAKIGKEGNTYNFWCKYDG